MADSSCPTCKSPKRGPRSFALPLERAYESQAGPESSERPTLSNGKRSRASYEGPRAFAPPFSAYVSRWRWRRQRDGGRRRTTVERGNPGLTGCVPAFSSFRFRLLPVLTFLTSNPSFSCHMLKRGCFGLQTGNSKGDECRSRGIDCVVTAELRRDHRTQEGSVEGGTNSQIEAGALEVIESSRRLVAVRREQESRTSGRADDPRWTELDAGPSGRRP